MNYSKSIWQLLGSWLIALCTVVALLLIGFSFARDAMADGVTHNVGDDLTYNCVPPTKYEDGTAIPPGSALTYKIYETQVPAKIGTAFYTGPNCNGVKHVTTGMAVGQWYGYLTATQEGRAESALSAAAPFTLLPPASVATEAGTLTVQ